VEADCDTTHATGVNLIKNHFPTTTMKVGLLQIAPEVGKVQENIRRTDEILQKSRIPADLDWLILPELAFTGEWKLM
jgi:hypothetical protein